MKIMLTRHILRSQRLLVVTLHRFLCDKVINQLDVIDAFTTHLVHCRLQSSPRDNVVKPTSMCALVKPSPNTINLASLDPTVIDDELLQLGTDGDDLQVNAFFSRCLQDRVCPSFQCVLCLLDSRSGSASIVANAKRLLQAQPSPTAELFKSHASFDHYEAEACWTNGEIVKALHLFDVVYRNHSSLRRRIKLMLKHLIVGITAESEAVLVSVVNFSEEWYHMHKEPFPLVCLWQACFISDCYEDHTLAMKLIERNTGLCEYIVRNVPYVVSTSLRANRVEIVYQLLELLLRHDMKQHYGSILVALLDYKCAQGDLRSCAEIVQWSALHNVTLPQILHDRFLMLLFKGKLPKDFKFAVQKRPNVTLKF